MKIKSENELVRELINNSMVTSSEVEKVYNHQKEKGVSILKSFIEMKLMSEDTLLTFVAKFLQIEYRKIIDYDSVNKDCTEKVPPKIAFRYNVIPVSLKNNKLTLCIANPFDMHMIDDMRTILNCSLNITIAPEDVIYKAINALYGVGAGTIDSMSSKVSEKTITIKQQYEKIDEITGESSIVTFVNQILFDAHKSRATDIHIEPYANDIAIRYRVDGILNDITVPKYIKNYQSSLITRIKIISGLDISEHRLPQDGRIKIATDYGTLDMRVSIMPTPFGESINIRLLSSLELLQLEQLGFNDENCALITKGISKNHGIIFLTGPTGSGKTTTLYACLNRMNKRDKKIITIEDPIEYQLEGITQIQVHPKIGLSFSKGLRSMLRHDPDVIMVGEVRDGETADISIRSALTGHLVFSTLHTNDAPSAITRLLDMDIEPYLISSGLEYVIAQRLVRILCPQCKSEHTPDKKELESIGVTIPPVSAIYKSNGCAKCNNSGYRKRTAIIEIMVINDVIRSLINKKASLHEIKDIAQKQGMKSLREDGWDKIISGMTSIDEILRVTQED